MSKRPKGNSSSAKKVLVITLLILVVGACLYFYFSTRHYQVRSVARTYLHYEELGDYGSSWNVLHSLIQGQIDQSTYVQERSQLFLQDFKAHSFNYKIEHIKHLNSWSPSPSIGKLSDVYCVTVDQTFQSQFGKQILINDIYVARDKKYQNKWRILWEMNQ